jgi:hypothetical protein
MSAKFAYAILIFLLSWMGAAIGQQSLPLLLTSGTFVPAGGSLTFLGACPGGWTEETALRGFYPVGVPSDGTVGNSLGIGMTGVSPPDVSYTPQGNNETVSFTPSGTVACTAVNAQTPVAAIVVCDNSPAPTFLGDAGTVPAQTFIGTANPDMRENIAPLKYVRYCKPS